MTKIRILWADDEIDLLKPQLFFLEKKGYEVIQVTNGHDALDSLSEDAISLRSDRDTLEVLIFPDKLYPVLLDTILNPWFVPPSRVSMASDGSYQYEGGIRGFQVVFLENHRQISQRDVGLVKQSCKNQLADQALAMQPNILEEASESARQILASWLSLLEPDKVVVVNIAAAH